MYDIYGGARSKENGGCVCITKDVRSTEYYH
jgi:hypothetical protein